MEYRLAFLPCKKVATAVQPEDPPYSPSDGPLWMNVETSIDVGKLTVARPEYFRVSVWKWTGSFEAQVIHAA